MFTIGHSNRSWEKFIGLLQLYEITILIDVRRYPVSKVHPHFSKDHFETELKKEGIAYFHMASLGGLRKPEGGLVNAGWEDHGFRGYADYMGSKEFRKAVETVLAMKGNIALMCAEAVPEKCHRQVLADYLTVQGIEVTHIISETEERVHKLPSFAKVEGKKVTYPSPQQTLNLSRNF